MTNTEMACFFLGWILLLHGLYTLSPVAAEITLALQFLIMAVPKTKGAKHEG